MKKAANFATATTIGLFLSAAAFADENFSNVVQDGFDNSGVVTQGPGDLNQVGTNADAALQSGSDNMLDILQSGERNQVGTRGSGLEQSGGRNVLVIRQLWHRNRINQVEQIGSAGAGARNSATVTQDNAAGGEEDSRNTVTSLRQQHTGGAANRAVITQLNDSADAGGNIVGIGGRNSVDGGLWQSGGGNEAELAQTGVNNRIRRVEQDGQRNAIVILQYGEGNMADALIEGNRNGATGAVFGLLVSGSNVVPGRIVQDGIVNDALLDVLGNRNLFGIAQDGGFNEAVGRMTGDHNEFAIHQTGFSNLGRIIVGNGYASNRNEIVLNQDSSAALGNEARIRVDGDANEVVLDQTGFFLGNEGRIGVDGVRNQVTVEQAGVNLANVMVFGDRNAVDLDQFGLNAAEIDITGNRNDVAASQSGLGPNAASVSITGNNNFADISQSQTGFLGDANSLTLNIFGDDNNRGPFTGGLPAAAFATAAGLLPGQIIQNGSGNSISMDVGSDVDPTSNANLFAFLQSGEDNGIVGVVLGNGNQAVIVQEGENNFTSFSQVGNFNNIGVNQ